MNLRLDGARDVKIDGNYAYVTSDIKDRFQIIDITNKAAPSFVSEVIHNGTTIFLDGAWGIEKQGNFLYVASSVSSALQVFDVSNPATPAASGVIRDATSTNHRFSGIRELTRSGNYLYASANADDSITVIDIETPSTPTQVTRISNNNTTILLDGVSGIYKL